MASALAVSVLGVTGYTGQVLADILLDHPNVRLVHATSASSGGKPLGAVLTALRGRTELVLEAPNGLERLARDSDVVFSCLPHGESGKAVAALRTFNPKALLVDLSGDLRLKDPSLAARWYGHAEPVAQEAVYGLSEVLGDEVAGAKVVSNPGCYPTSALLPLIPVLKARLATGPAIIDSKSGVTGAGKQPTPFTHFGEVAESVKAYKVGEHKHAPEIEQALARWANAPGPVTFTPHLVPMLRGILSTIYLDAAKGTTTESVLETLASFYKGRRFVRVLPQGELPDTKDTWGTNFCDVGAVVTGGKVVLFGALDNLVKGAAGQAVQNMNLALGLPETTGLLAPPKSARLQVAG